MVIESSQTRTGDVDLLADPAHAQAQDVSTTANQARGTAFRAALERVATLRKIVREHRDVSKCDPMPICLCPRQL